MAQPGMAQRCSVNYHGFRWAIIDGLTQAPELADATAELISGDWKTVGSFECSCDLLNRMHQVNLWTARATIFSPRRLNLRSNLSAL